MVNMYRGGYNPYNPSALFVCNDTQVALNTFIIPTYKEGLVGFNCWWRTIDLAEKDRADIECFIKLLGLHKDIYSIEKASWMSFERIQFIVQTLYELGIITITSKGSIPALAFYNHALSVMRARRHKMLQENPLLPNAFLPREDEPKTHTRQLLGFLVEAYHFSSSAASHISLAIAQTTRKAVENDLSRYLANEYWHGALLAKGLVKAGISQEELAASSPTFPILGIINFMRDIARRDLHSYGICLALTEADSSSHSLLIHKQELWDQVRALDLLPEGTIKAFYEHEVIDFEEKHDDVPKVIFETDEVFSFTRCQEILHNAACYIDMIGYAYTYLKQLYQDSAGKSWFSIA